MTCYDSAYFLFKMEVIRAWERYSYINLAQLDPKSRTTLNSFGTAPIKLTIAYFLNSCSLAIEPKIKIQDKSQI